MLITYVLLSLYMAAISKCKCIAEKYFPMVKIIRLRKIVGYFRKGKNFTFVFLNVVSLFLQTFADEHYTGQSLMIQY